MAEKTKQHFVPKMLLKRYSWDGIHVNLCNIRKTLELKPVPYEPQCQKRYFYGKDKKIENNLSKVEGVIDLEITKLVSGCLVPLMNLSCVYLDSKELRREILSYIYIQYTRTQKAKNLVSRALDNHFDIFKKQKKEDILNDLIKKSESNSWGLTRDDINNLIDSCTIEKNNLFEHIFNEAYRQYNRNSNLKGVLLFNLSKIPFITSDNPVLNIVTLFPENVLSFFMPVSPAHCLFFYDEHYFTVQHIENVVFISNTNEISYINMMQCENCESNIYLPHLSSDLTLRDVLGENIHGGQFFNHIKAISLSEDYSDNIIIPIAGGHATTLPIRQEKTSPEGLE